MPPPKTILIDDGKLLEAIQTGYNERYAAIASLRRECLAKYETARGHERNELWRDAWLLACDLDEMEERGIDCDLAAFLGRDLSPSWRIRAQQAIRRLIESGKLVRDGKKIKPVVATQQPETTPRGAAVGNNPSEGV